MSTLSHLHIILLRFFPTCTIDYSSVPCTSRGEPTNTMMRRRRFLFSRFLRASCKTAIAVWMAICPQILLAAIWTLSLWMIWPRSFVWVTRTSGLFVKKVDQCHSINNNYLKEKLTNPFPFIVVVPTVYVPQSNQFLLEDNINSVGLRLKSCASRAVIYVSHVFWVVNNPQSRI